MTPFVSAISSPSTPSPSRPTGQSKPSSQSGGDKQLETPPPSQSPPEPSPLREKKSQRDQVDVSEGRTGGEERDLEGSGEVSTPRAEPSSEDTLTTPTKSLSSALPPSPKSSESPPPSSSSPSLFSHLPSDAIPADFLDSAQQSSDLTGVETAAAPAYPSPASTLRPPPETEGLEDEISRGVLEKLEERLGRSKEPRREMGPLKVDTSFQHTNPANSSSSSGSGLQTPTSPALPPRPNSSSSRPGSRPPSISRRPTSSEFGRNRSRSSSSSSRGNHRLSVSSSSSATSPRLSNPADGGGEHFTIPPSPLGPSRRTSSQNVNPQTSATPSSSITTTPTESTAIVGKEEEKVVEPWEVKVVVRDWAYEESDPRHLGLPHPDLLRKDDSEDERERSGGMGGGMRGRFRRNRSPQKKRPTDAFEEVEGEGEGLGLGSEIDRTLRRGGGGNGEPSPSSATFSWGFVTSHSTDFPSSSPASSDHDDPDNGYSFHDADHDNDEEHGGGGGGWEEREIEEELGLGEFVPGVYQAVYEFVPELETEMKLEVGEWVSVFERQCAGWVQAGRIVGGVLTDEVGLVPENYLHRLDFEEGEGELIDPDPAESSTNEKESDQHEWKSTGKEEGKEAEAEEQRKSISKEE